MSWWPESWTTVLVPDAPLAELLVRGTAVYFFLYAMMRVAGRRLLGRFSMSDTLVILLIAVALRDGITGPYQTVGDALISGAVILAWDLVVDRIAFHSDRARPILRHRSKPIILDGTLLAENARASLLTRTEILQNLRRYGVSSCEQVREAYLEADGSLTVVPKRE